MSVIGVSCTQYSLSAAPHELQLSFSSTKNGSSFRLYNGYVDLKGSEIYKHWCCLTVYISYDISGVNMAIDSSHVMMLPTNTNLLSRLNCKLSLVVVNLVLFLYF